MNDNFNRKHGEILVTAEKIQSVSIRFNSFQSDLSVKGKHGEILDTAQGLEDSIRFNSFQSVSI